MGNVLSGITSAQLRRAIKIKERLERLEQKLGKLLGASASGGSYSGNGVKARGGMSAAGKRKLKLLELGMLD